MQHPQFDGVILEDKWGKTYLCSNCLFAYSELGDNTLWHSRDKVYASYFLHDLQPEWNQRQIWVNIYRQARPWQSDLSGLTDFQLRDSLIHMLANDEIRLWQLTDGWGQPPEDNGIGDGGLAPATSSAPPPLRSTPKRQGGAIANAETAELKAKVPATENHNKPNVLSGSGSNVRMDAHKIYDSAFDPLSTNPNAQYRFSDPSFRNTGQDIYFGENIATSYFEVRKSVSGKSLFVADLEIQNLLDLTDENVAKNMNIDLAKLNKKVDTPIQQKKVYAYTNQIANQAYDAGYNGIIYNSSRKEGNNKAVVLFGGRFDKSKITPIINRPIK